MYTASQVQHIIIRPTLELLGESHGALPKTLTAIYWLYDQTSPNTFGPFLITHNQHWQLWDNHLAKDADLASKVRGFASQQLFLKDPDQELNTNLGYAVAIAATWLQSLIKTPLSDLCESQLFELWLEQQSGFDSATKERLSTNFTRFCKELNKNAA